MDTEMRWKMPTNSPRNATIPEASVAAVAGAAPAATAGASASRLVVLAFHVPAAAASPALPAFCASSACASDGAAMRRHAVASSFQKRAASARTSESAFGSAFGSAPSTTEAPNTMAMSSASPSCVSRAASSSSVATDQDTENVRSPPSEESASAAPAVAIDAFLAAASHLRAPRHAVATVCFTPQLAAAVAKEVVSLVRSGRAGQSLCMRRLLLDACEPAAGGVHSLDAVHASKSAIRKKARVSGEAKRAPPPCSSARARRIAPPRRRVGVIVGATLQSVLQFAGVDVSRSCVRQMRHLVRFFEPVVSAVCRVEGDREVLASGLACHRVLREQRRHMDEADAARRTWLARKGLKNVAMGVTASVLVAHYIAAQEGADADAIAQGLEECCANAEKALRRWKICDSSDGGLSLRVMDAEARALGRARAACAAATKQARAHGLRRHEALRLQLEAMRRAAWPAGERCDAQTHAELCGRIALGMALGSSAPMPAPMPSGAAVPLSAIPAEAWLDDESARDTVVDDSASSAASSSQWSASSSSCGSLDADAYERAVAPLWGEHSDELWQFAFRIE